MRCKWGNTQEATALFELMHALPEGSLEEVGLCMADPAALEARYGFSLGRLPPMGASPDGLMRQRHASPAASVSLYSFVLTRSTLNPDNAIERELRVYSGQHLCR